MRNKFLNRVDAERVILSTVNKRKKMNLQLHGLSNSAINDWAERNSINSENELLKLILKASEMTHSLADVSNEVFNKEEEDISSDIHKLNEELTEVISR